MLKSLSLYFSILISAGSLGLAAAQLQQPSAPKAPTGTGTEFFERKIRPLLVSECYSCHSATSKPLMGGLRLDSKQSLLAGGSHGVALIPGDPDKSLLVQAVRFTGKIQMPPKGKLSASQIADIEAWVKMGAPDPRVSSEPAKLKGMSVEEGRKHWSFQPLRLTPPRSTLTQSEKSWRRNSIDDFILDKLRKKRLSPSAIADRRTLIRRAYFDLIGLPPAPAEVEKFVNDKSPDAWQRVVDGLLASSHYGERWGRHWLDLARFAESHGYEQDYDRPNAYHYRDFVIKALNDDLPYTKFVQWQIAGDELEPESPMALTATGFLAAGTHATQITKNQVEKERYDELDDMLSTTFTSMLGLTVGCARCHDHKFDPIPANDYYRLLSTFTTTVRSDYDVNLDPEGYRLKKAAFDREHEPFAKALKDYESDSFPSRLSAVLRDKSALTPAEWLVATVQEAKSAGGATLTAQPDGSYLATGKNPDSDTYSFTLRTDLPTITGLRIEALSHPTLVKGGPGRAANGNFDLTNVKVTAAPASDPTKTSPVKLVEPRADFEQKGLPISAALDGDAKSGWAVDPEFGKDHVAAFAFNPPVASADGAILTVTLSFDGNTAHSIGRPRISISGSAQRAALNGTARPERVESILKGSNVSLDTLSEMDRATLLSWYKGVDPGYVELQKQAETHLTQEPKPPLQKTLISSEGVTAVRTHTQGGDFLEQTHILKRGDPNQKLSVASQSFLQVLMRTPEAEAHWISPPPKEVRTSYRRLALAKWMTDMEKGAGPLLARVIVNRLWQHHMGRGIVSTPSDFGVIGDRPSHPELLDWLAMELVRNGWRLKPVHKLILTSATYMQRSIVDPKKAAIDPDNRLVWRHQRKRLEAESIRDAMLSASGLLDPKLYGPGTLDENMKRRSIYFFVKRSRLIASLIIFDGPNALLGLPQRATTTVAPQALHLMNNKGVRECAVALALKSAPGPDTPTSEAINRAYRTTLGREPSNVELKDATAFIDSQAASYGDSADIAVRRAAIADFCQVLFSLNEFIYVE